MTTLIDLPPAGNAPTSATATPSHGAAPATRTVPPATRPANPSTIPLSPTFSPPVASAFEKQADWDSHLLGVVEFYAPEGYVEHACAHRIASHLWRLNRVSRYETDALSASYHDVEGDAAATLASADSPDDFDPALRRVLRDPNALRQRLKDARLTAQIIFDLSQHPGHETIPDEHAAVALRFISDFCGGDPGAVLPGRETADQWTGSRLRQAMAKIPVNRSLGDVIAGTTTYAHTTADSAQRRLNQIDVLAKRLRRQRLAPDPTLATQVRDAESHLDAALDHAIYQLDLLQSRRLGVHGNK